MATIEERVVAMSFENAVFEQRAAQTMATLGKLNEAIKSVGGAVGFDKIEKDANKVTLQAPMSALDKLKSKLSGAGSGAAEGLGEIDRAGNKVTLEGPAKAVDKLQGKMGQLSAGSTFTDIDKAASRVTLEGLTRALDTVTGKFSVLEGAASVALGNISSQAAMKGASFAKSFAVGPIVDGFKEYSTNLNSIQTILANTQDSGGNLKGVNSALQELNTYSDKTIYNFSEMAKNIGTFTAAGVQLKPATSAIKGIANLAALSGSNSQQASTAMYQLSQAIASGKVGLQDWNSVVNAGMGGAVFQKALMRTAESMGTVKKGAVEIDKATGKATVNGQSFRDSIMAKPGQKSWLSSDVLTKTLSQFTGDMTDAQLATQGFTADQIKSIQAQAKTAQAAATEVKTLPQVFDVARETIGSGWGTTFQTIFGDFGESKKTFTEMSNAINGFINNNSKARNALLKGWKDLGGRIVLIAGIKDAFHALMDVIKPIKDAFQEIFPPKTGKDLFEATKGFAELMAKLDPSQKTIDNLRRTFAGLFAVLHIAKSIVGGVVGVILDLLGVVGKGAGGFLGFTGSVGDFLVAVDTAITKGGALTGFFNGLGAIIKKPLSLIGKLTSAISGMFAPSTKGMTAKDHIQELDKFGKVLTPAERLVNKLKDAWGKLVDGFDKAKSALEPWFSAFVDKISNLGQMIGDALSNLKFDDVMKGVQTGLLAGLILMIKNLFGKGGGLIEEISKTLGSVQKLLGGVSGQLETMQKKVQAETILAIAGSVLALAAGVFILSTIDGDKLAKAMSAVAIGLGELMGGMKIMMGGMGKFAALQLPLIAAGLIGLSVAIIILAGAMKIFATMSWEDIGKGLTGVAGSLGVIAGAMRLMPPGPAMIVQAAGLLILGVALNAIAAAVKSFAGMSWEDLGKGLFGLVDALGLIAITMAMMPPNLLVSAAGILVLSFALVTLSGAIKAMGSMDFMTLLKGLGGVAVALAIIGVAMWLMPPNMLLIGAGLVVVGVGLIAVSKAIEIMGNMSIASIVKGLGALAGALTILSVGLYLMMGTLPGSVALLAAAAALAVLAPTLALLGQMSWGTIFKGLGAIALVLGTIAVVGLIAAPALAALGIALIPLGVGFILVAMAAKLFATALATLSEVGPKGIAIFLTAITGFVAILPGIIISFIKGLVEIVDSIADLAPKVVIALGVIIDTIIAFVITEAPKLAIAIGVLVDSLIQVLLTNSPKLISAGIQLLKNLLDGISQNINEITNKVSEIIVKFLGALANKMPDLITAGIHLLTTFLTGISNHFIDIVNTVDHMIKKFVEAVGTHFRDIATIGGNLILSFLGGIADEVPDIITKGTDIILSFIEGLGKNINLIVTKGADVIIAFIDGLGKNANKIANKGADAIIKFLNGLAETIRTKGPELRQAGKNVASALLDGIADGFTTLAHKVVDKLGALIHLLPKAARKLLGINSPSTVFAEIGRYSMEGFSKGIGDGSGGVRKSVEGVGKDSMRGMAKGVADNQSLVSDAALGASSRMLTSVQGFLGIHSPSEVFRDIGMNINRGFVQGLKGSEDDVISAFDSLNSSLIDKIRDLRGQVADGNSKLEDLQQQHADKLADIAKLRTEKKPDNSAIADAIKESQDLETQIMAETAAVNQNGKALDAARAMRKTLTVGLKDEEAQLIALKKNYADITTQLDAASQALTDAQKARDDAQSKYTSQFDVAPDIDQLVSDALANAALTEQERQDKARQAKLDADKKAAIDQVALYKQALQEQIVATAKYQATLQKLRELGLDDATYNKLLDKGLAGQDFADQLVKSGKTGVDQINQLDMGLLAKSTDLAKQAADNLYNAGIAAAQGLVDGLTTKKADLDAAMTALATTMVNAIKSQLKIKSPSRIFAEIGQFTALGLAQGLESSTSAVVESAQSLGDSAASALRSSLSQVLDTVSNEVDPTLTITPVLDLTQIKKDAAGIKDLSNVIPITAATSYGQASAASQEVSATQQAAQDAAAATTPTVSFEQNNYSPEALNAVEIYRQTRNQVGQLKSALGIPATAA